MAVSLDVIVGRIETLAVDAIVNPANTALAPGGGADGAIRKAAGPELGHLLAAMGVIAEGAAVVTPGFRLPARWIVHTAAPVFTPRRSERALKSLLAQCYRSCIESAAELALRTIAFPSIGAGAFGWPLALQCEIAVEASRTAAHRCKTIEAVLFCCFSEADAEIYRRRLFET